VCPIVPDYVPGENCDSSFKYLLEDERGKKTAAKGLANFYQCISQVLAFNKKFERILVVDKRTKIYIPEDHDKQG
jgi:hypothetical protein